MISPSARTQPQPHTVATPRVTPGKVVAMLDAVSAQDRIRERAYELYEARGRKPGQDQQDWFHAEEEIRNQKR